MEYTGTTLTKAHQYNRFDPSHSANVSIKCTNAEVDKIEEVGGLNELKRRISGLMSLVAAGERGDEKRGYQTIIFVMNGSRLAKDGDERSTEETEKFGRETYDIVRTHLG